MRCSPAPLISLEEAATNDRDSSQSFPSRAPCRGTSHVSDCPYLSPSGNPVRHNTIQICNFFARRRNNRASFQHHWPLLPIFQRDIFRVRPCCFGEAGWPHLICPHTRPVTAARNCFNVSSRSLLSLVKYMAFIVWLILITALILILQIGLVSDGDTAARAQNYSLLACSFTWRVLRCPHISILCREHRASRKPVQCCARVRSSEGTHSSPIWRRF